MGPFFIWLIQGAVGPAVVGLPVTWAATDLAGAAKRWFRRMRRSDGLGRIVRAAAGDGLGVSDAEFAAIRRLLEQESTWVVMGRGTVEDLAKRIASCLPGRADEGALAAARAIAAGLLEFAVRDLEPELFQQVLFARLDRMQADQASALDQAMLSVHADLAAQLARQDAADARRFARVIGQLGRVLDRLPPGPADQGEVAVYLARLIKWLNTDPWALDPRFDGPLLTPAAIERKLRIAGGWEDLDADDLARRCARLVVLGGPGSGKTWLAKRTARICAEAALDALAAGAGVDEVELPLYTTCARLLAAPPGEGIRRAVVSSALGQLPDLGGSRVIDAVRALFDERDAPTLLVADSLDEARGVDDRIRQADTLPAGWRIVLTSRPAAWNRQLAIGDGDLSRRAGVLLPLRYPDDVEPFISGWFRGRPAWAAGLAAQIRHRPALQQAATVPLILAFYCIVGGDQPLPARRAVLYAKVIRRMLTGRWRDSGDHDPDPEACLETLRDWAWSAAASDPVSGIGAWADEFCTARVRQGQADRDALDHVAPPLGPADVDTGMTQRRFIHRSIREHLVADHIAFHMPAEQAAAALLNHLWYDPDWEYAAPAALAMHPQRDHLLKQLICRVTRGDQLRADLAAIDGCGEFRRFLARVAMESGEGDWPREAAQMIGQARLFLAMSPQGDLRQVVASDWPTSNGPIIDLLLAQLSGETDAQRGRRLAEVVAELDPAKEERARARDALLALLAADAEARTAPSMVYGLADVVARLAVTVEERAHARHALLALLPVATYGWVAEELADVARLAVTVEERAQTRQALLALLTAETVSWWADVSVDVLARLAVTVEERAQTRQALLTLLTATTDPEVAKELATAFIHLEPTKEERVRARQALLALLPAATHPWVAGELAGAAAQLDPTKEERALAQEVLLRLLTGETSLEPVHALPEAEWALVRAAAGLAVTAEERARVRETLLALLPAAAFPPRRMWQLVRAVAHLEPTTEERAQARETLLAVLPTETDAWRAFGLASMVAQLDPAKEERSRAQEALLALLPKETSAEEAWSLVGAVARLAVTAEERARGWKALLTTQTDPPHDGILVETATQLAVTAEERARGQETLLAMLPAAASSWRAERLADAIAHLAVTAEERARAREALLTLLADETVTWRAATLANAVAHLEPTTEQRARAREKLLTLLADETDPQRASGLANAITELEPTAEERARAREALLALFDGGVSAHEAWGLVGAVGRLAVTAEERAHAIDVLFALRAWDTDPLPGWSHLLDRLMVTAEDRTRAREALLALITGGSDPGVTAEFAELAADLNPTVADLRGSDTWPYPPTPALLAAARQNSALPAWLAALPLLSISAPPLQETEEAATTPNNE